jgi:cyclopropane fatty-acyl-phospholipid synthase-like methyltransferase
MATTKTKKKNQGAKTYYPQKTFDDDLTGLVDLYAKSGWSFSNIDLNELTKDADDQRTERLAHDALQVQYEKTHADFGEAQERRHQRFSAALNAARGAFRNDKGVTAQLDKFKRSMKAKAKPAAP